MKTKRVWMAGVVVLVLTGVQLFASAASPQADGKRWAVIKGIDRYESSDMTPIRVAVADARVLAAELRRSRAFDTVMLMTSETTDPKSHDQPKAANILAWIEAIVGRAGPNGTFVFQFSGHGFQPNGVPQQVGTIETDCLTPTPLEQTALPVNSLAESIETLRARNVLLLVDASRSNAERDKSEGDNRMAPDFSRRLLEVARKRSKKRTCGGTPVAAVLSACSPREQSWQGPKLSHGVFTHQVLEGLRALAASLGGVAFTALAAHAEKMPQLAGMQPAPEQVTAH